jgi:hypothetical protein
MMEDKTNKPNKVNKIQRLSVRITRWTKYKLAMLTYSCWHPLIFKALVFAENRGIIDTRQWYKLAALLDRTQVHFVLKKASTNSLGGLQAYNGTDATPQIK